MGVMLNVIKVVHFNVTQSIVPSTGYRYSCII